LLPVLLEGAEKTFENAEQLFREAQILGESGAVARSLCLHQISLEECSKVDSLGAWATSLVLDFAVDQKKVLSALSRHSSKNKLNAYMLDVTDEEVGARARGDWKVASELFRESQNEFHAKSNRAKNSSLYVDWVEGAFIAPSERITSEMMVDSRELNALFLGYAFNNLKTLRRLVEAPDALKQPMKDLLDQMETLRDKAPADLLDQVDAMVSRFLDHGMAAARSAKSDASQR
jgi:AbiV family abortive infection protein